MIEMGLDALYISRLQLVTREHYAKINLMKKKMGKKMGKKERWNHIEQLS